MYRILEYGVLFVTMVVLQVFLFDRLGISLYIHPLIYIAFIILLPMEISGSALLFISFGLGATLDFFMGTAGVNTIASLFAAFSRPGTLTFLVGKDEMKEGGIPNVNRLGIKRFMRYAAVVVVLHGAVFFILESLSWRYMYLTLIRIAVSSVITLGLVYCSQRFFAVNRQGGYDQV